MMDTASTLCLTSYNSGSMGIDKQTFISLLSWFSDILCIHDKYVMELIKINVFYLCIILHIFFSFLLETCIFKKKIYLNKFKLHHLYMYLYLCA